MFAACRLADAGIRGVTLFEKNDRLGKKLAITGKGRCNLTNRCTPGEVLLNVPTNPKFLYSALRCLSPEDVTDYFENVLGVRLKTERGNRVFPQSDRASEIVLALKRHLEKGGVRTVNARVRAIAAEGGAVRAVETDKGSFDCDAVIFCPGGCSYPSTGSDGKSYAIVTALRHTVVPPRPSLVPLETAGSLHLGLQGLSLKNTGLKLVERESGRVIYEDLGEMLFTHFGLSGPTVLSASAHMRDAAAGKYEIVLDLKPGLDEKTLDRRLLSDFEKYSNKDLQNALHDLLPAKMIPAIITASSVDPHKKVHEITKEERVRLRAKLKALRFTVTGFRPIDEAIVTSGGVNVNEVRAATMESKFVKGLYFAGEVLDVDAYTGGFNLQIAFSTAALAARSLCGALQDRIN